jgi:Tol biopolymer transport system component
MRHRTPAIAITLSLLVALPATAAEPAGSQEPGGPWIAYQTWSGDPDIHLVRSDGADDHRLVTGSHPDWSPDGTRLAYETGGDTQGIWVIAVDGSGARKVFDCTAPCVLVDSPAWSPDGRSLAFTLANADGDTAPGASIVAAEAETGALTTLLETTAPDYPFYPRWSPDGSALVVSIQRFASAAVDDCSPIASAILVVHPGSVTASRYLTDFALFGDFPDWSPDGSTIVFTTRDLGTRDYGCTIDPAPPSDLYTIHPDGSGLTQLTRNTAGTDLVRPITWGPFADEAHPRGTASGPLSGQPTWSPDGGSIIFTQVDGPEWPGYAIWTIGPDGSGMRPLDGLAGTEGSHARIQPGARGS